MLSYRASSPIWSARTIPNRKHLATAGKGWFKCHEKILRWVLHSSASTWSRSIRKKPGRYVLAIECDGASYHSSYTARDHDRLRQQQLKNLGWRFHRIWSTDWFMRKDEEIARTMKSFQEAVRFADRLNGGSVLSNHTDNGNHRDRAYGLPKRGPRPPIPVHTTPRILTASPLADIFMPTWRTEE